jgi:DHA2 family multidrug resistance protein-like MFS transporter
MTEAPAQAGRKEWTALGVLVLPLLLVSMDMTVLYFAIPSIAATLAPSSSQQLWMIDIYAFVLSGLLITMGNIGDRIGRRRLLTIGALAFGIASIAAAYSSSAEMLIAARAVQGIGGATLMPSTLALVRNIFHDDKQRRTAIAIWSTGLSAGAALGPVVSGLLLNSFWWGAIFLINAPIMVLLLVLAPALVPEFRVRDAGKFDLLSALMSLAAVLPVIYGLKEIAVHGIEPLPLVIIATGLLFGLAFIRRQRTLTHPMIEPELFGNRDFGSSITISLTCFFSMIGFGIFTTQYLMEVLRMTPLSAALWTMPAPIAASFLVPVAAVAVRTIRPAYIIATGFALSTIGFLLMTQLPVERNMAIVVAATVCIGVGVAVVLTIITDMVVAAAPVERAGSASALVQTAQELGGALGIALLGSVGAAVYGHSVDSTLPAGLPAGTLEAARQTIGGASTVARTLPADAGKALLHVARVAFTDSLHAAAITGAAVTATAAVFAVVRLRHIRSAPSEGTENTMADALDRDAVAASH